MRLFLAFFALLWVALSAAQLPGIQWSVLRTGQNGQIMQERTEVLNTEGQFQTFWRELMGNAPFPTGVDWRNELVIGITLGQRTTGGYRVFVREIVRERSDAVVKWVEETPGGMATQALTAPFVLVRVQRAGATFKFQKSTRRGDGGEVIGGRRDYSTLLHEVSGGGETPREQLIRSSRELETLARSLGVDTPKVDWDREIVVAIHLGRKPTTGYDVLIEDVRFFGDQAMVRYVRLVPGPDQVVRRQATSPVIWLRLPRVENVRFQSRTWDGSG